MKKAQTNEMIQWIGVTLIALVMFYVLMTWIESGVRINDAVEKGSIVYTVASSVNALSSMEEGEITRYLHASYDIEVKCYEGKCSVLTLQYTGEIPGAYSSPVSLIGTAEPTFLKRVNKVTLTKDLGGPVRLTGEKSDEYFDGKLEIPNLPAKCIYAVYPNLKPILSNSRILQGEEPELVAAIIMRESSGNSNSYRYEPNYQLLYIDNSPVWTKPPLYLTAGPTIEDVLPFTRSGEISKWSESDKNRVAQTKLSASYGLMQLMYPTAWQHCQGKKVSDTKTVDLSDPEILRRDNEVNIFCGISYLKFLRTRHSDPMDVVSAYNAGRPKWEFMAANRGYTRDVMSYYEAFKKCEEIA